MTIWNWKAGVLSAIYRAPIFLLTSLQAGWRLAIAAMFAETAFRVLTSGFYGALTQAFRRLEPPWVAFAIILVLAPAAVQLLEFLVHHFTRTPNLKTGVLISTAMTALASLFNWYSMRQGAMLTGREARPFSADLKRFPALIYGFVTAIPIAIAGRLRRDR
jgi:hypothetical protein